MVHDGLQQGLVQLGLVEAAEDKQDVGADALMTRLILRQNIDAEPVFAKNVQNQENYFSLK